MEIDEKDLRELGELIDDLHLTLGRLGVRMPFEISQIRIKILQILLQRRIYNEQ